MSEENRRFLSRWWYLTELAVGITFFAIWFRMALKLATSYLPFAGAREALAA